MLDALAKLNKDNNGRTHKLNVYDISTKPNFAFLDDVCNNTFRETSTRLMGSKFPEKFVAMVSEASSALESNYTFSEKDYAKLYDAWLEDTKNG